MNLAIFGRSSTSVVGRDFDPNFPPKTAQIWPDSAQFPVPFSDLPFFLHGGLNRRSNSLKSAFLLPKTKTRKNERSLRKSRSGLGCHRPGHQPRHQGDPHQLPQQPHGQNLPPRDAAASRTVAGQEELRAGRLPHISHLGRGVLQGGPNSKKKVSIDVSLEKSLECLRLTTELN